MLPRNRRFGVVHRLAESAFVAGVLDLGAQKRQFVGGQAVALAQLVVAAELVQAAMAAAKVVKTATTSGRPGALG